jgi:hypothetical protein
MKLKLLLCALCASVASIAALAAIPTYRNFSGYGYGTVTNATVILPADPNSQIRIVTILYGSDSASGQFQFTTGGAAYSLVSTNPATTSITNAISSTNGLYGGAILVLQHLGADYTNSVVSWGNVFTNLNGLTLTNVPWVVTGSGGFGVLPSVGDNIWAMTNSASWYAGATTNELNGDDIYSGNYGCPVMVQLGPPTTTNRLYNVAAHYDSASQP